MANKTKYYVVWAGRRPGVYATWAECEAQVKGFSGAQFRGDFPTRAAAEAAFESDPRAHVGVNNPKRTAPAPRPAGPPPPAEALVVDASCPGNPGPVEYRGVHYPSGRVLFKQGPYPNGTNNIGEFLAVVQALQAVGARGLPVYTDSATALAWLRQGRARTSHTPGAELASRLAQAEAWLAAQPALSVHKWETEAWGENPADYGRKS